METDPNLCDNMKSERVNKSHEDHHQHTSKLELETTQVAWKANFASLSDVNSLVRHEISKRPISNKTSVSGYLFQQSNGIHIALCILK